MLAGVLQPAAIDLWNPPAGATIGNRGWILAIRAGGNAAVVDRYERELAGLGAGVAFEGDQHNQLWRHIEDFTPQFLERHADGAVVRASCTLKDVEAVMASFEGPALARAASGGCYGFFETSGAAAAGLVSAAKRGWRAVMEFAPQECRRTLELWPASPGEPQDLELMRRVKALFDPSNLLNRGRLYRRI